MKKNLALKSLVSLHFSKANRGMGVVVEDANFNRWIITAAHCVPYPVASGAGNIHAAVGVTAFKSAKTAPLLACAVALEPCVDIGVLGLETNSGAMSPDFEALDQLFGSFDAARCCLDVSKLGRKFRVRVCQHTGKWVSGVVELHPSLRAPAIIGVQFPKSQPMLPGTSGSPAFDDAGRVVAVVSTSTNSDGSPDGSATLSCLAGALPGWMLENLKATKEAIR